MEHLLSATMHRRISIINILTSSSKWTSAERLSQILKCSSKTILSDCHYIEERWPEYLTFELSKKKGIHLELSPHRSVHDVYLDIIRETNGFILIEHVFFNSKKTIEYWESTLFLSYSSMYRLFNQLEKLLKSKNILLNHNPYFFL